MSWLPLYKHQRSALERMHDGCILCGGVGSGKSMTGLAYYYICYGGSVDAPEYIPMDEPADLYIITTARKRDTFEWDGEMLKFFLTRDSEVSLYNSKVIVDSWNNIKKYEDVKDAFFIFDEQRVVGSGAWVKAFLKIAKSNRWILLSATPGDTWTDYIPVMVANGFYKNRTSFIQEHIIWNPYKKFRQVDRYLNQKKLRIIRDHILVDMPMARETIRHDINVMCSCDLVTYRHIMRDRWDPWEKKPIENPAELCYLLRKVTNSNSSRVYELNDILNRHQKVIIFYNFDYELDILRRALDTPELKVAEWNGHKHEIIPEGDHWVYLVQYSAGAEGWNCTKSDCIVFFSQNYSYKTMQQAAGRIDRLNTPFKDLYYYHFMSKAPIDLAIRKALISKKNFNESRFIK